MKSDFRRCRERGGGWGFILVTMEMGTFNLLVCVGLPCQHGPCHRDTNRPCLSPCPHSLGSRADSGGDSHLHGC